MVNVVDVSPTLFVKRLTKTDLGVAGPNGKSNQGGVGVPRAGTVAFPPLDPEILNPEVAIEVEDQNGGIHLWRYIYFNSKLHGVGSRNEHRLTSCMPYLRSRDLDIGDLLRMDRISEIEYAVSVETARPQPPSGAGYRSNQRDRTAIEQFAMDIAARHYTDLGYGVENTSANNSFDLRVHGRSGDSFTVEVKGTTGDGSVVELTAGEVRHNRDAYPNTVLFIVHGIRLSHDDRGVPECSGGTFDLVEQWLPSEEDLNATRYRYRTGVGVDD